MSQSPRKLNIVSPRSHSFRSPRSSSGSFGSSPRDNNENRLSSDASFMDKYSRQIGAYGLDTMAKVLHEIIHNNFV